MQKKKIQKDLDSKPNICPNILHADADADAGGIAIALLH